MVSLDDPEKNREFADSLGASFVLLSDPKGRSARAYDVLALGGLYARRVTFYIDGEGVIREIDRDVRSETHGEDVVKALGRLGFPRRPDSD